MLITKAPIFWYPTIDPLWPLLKEPLKGTLFKLVKPLPGKWRSSDAS